MKKTIIIFGVLILTLLLLFKISTYSYMSGTITIEMAIAIIAIIFFIIGIYLNKKSLHKETSSKKNIDLKKVEELELSSRSLSNP